MSRKIACHLSSQNYFEKSVVNSFNRAHLVELLTKKYTIPDSGYSNHDLC